MRLLLDEQVPRVFGESLTGHSVSTAQEMGWSGLENGELLQRAAAGGFAALVTIDKGIEFQQNLAQLPISVVLLRARSNRIEDLEPMVTDLLSALEELQPREFVRVGV